MFVRVMGIIGAIVCILLGGFFWRQLQDGKPQIAVRTTRYDLEQTGYFQGALAGKGPLVFVGTDEAFVGSDGQKIVALDAKTGQIAWSVDMEEEVLASLHLSDEKLLAASRNYLLSLDPLSGETLWRALASPTATPIDELYCAPVIANSKVVVCSSLNAKDSMGYELMGYDVVTGKRCWEIKVDGYCPISICVEDDDVYTVAYEHLHILDLETGEIQKTKKVDKCTDFTITEKYVILTSEFFVTALDKDTLKEVWKNERLTDIYQIPAVSRKTLVVIYNNSPTMRELGDDTSQLACVDVDTGKIVWNKDLKTSAVGNPCIDQGVVYVSLRKGKLLAFDLDTGEEVWSAQVAETLDGPPAVANGALYVCSRDGYIHSLSARDGKLLWKTEIGGKMHSPPIVAD